MSDILKAISVWKVFRSGIAFKRNKIAVKNVSFSIKEGETFTLLGESGSGKTTLGKLSLALIKPTSGNIAFKGLDFTKANKEQIKRLQRNMGFIPQSPETALDPRWKIYDSIAEPLRLSNLSPKEVEIKVYELAEKVALERELLSRYPHELSGGELQRAVIARAIALTPKFIVCDEPTSMLDVSIQASIINLLLDLKNRLNVTFLFITHDTELAEAISDRTAIMFRGEIVEEGKDIFTNPLHPYTKALFEAKRKLSKESPPERETGCSFLGLCEEKFHLCYENPKSFEIEGHRVKCWLYK